MAEKPRVALLLPRYGDINPGMARGSYGRPTEGDVVLLDHIDAATSATPHCFNIALVYALNAIHNPDLTEDRKPTHIAMLHSDIEPLYRHDLKQKGRSGAWLDILWHEMKTTGADLVSVVVPIKDPDAHKNPGKNRTSTAIGHRDIEWYPSRYINLEDRERLPQTFGPEHVCNDNEVLLVNTGCFLADLRRPWWDNFAFEFKTRIVRETAGNRVAQFAPEDWLMSRHIASHGGRVAATWAVPVRHHGAMAWESWV